jgi:large subunit ribosomal protein L15
LKLHELRSPEGARQRKQRVGRGTGSGRGKTSGRGSKGQQARSEGFRVGFEGGQMPLAQRLPKLGGFKNPFKKHYRPINVSKLNRFKNGTEITPDVLLEAGLVGLGESYKVLGAGKLGRKLKVSAHGFSEAARAAIEKAGGTVAVIGAEDAAPIDAEAAAKSAEKAAAKAEARSAAKAEAEAQAEAEDAEPQPEAKEADAEDEPRPSAPSAEDRPAQRGGEPTGE